MKHFHHSHKVTSLLLSLTHEYPWSGCLDVKRLEQQNLKHSVRSVTPSIYGEANITSKDESEEISDSRKWCIFDSCCPVNLHHVQRKLLTFSLFYGARSLWSLQAAGGGTNLLAGWADVLVSPLTTLTWQALPSRPWPCGPDWIKSLPGWRIECCCQLDISTSPPHLLSTSPPSTPKPWQPLLSISSEGNPGLKASSPPPPSPSLLYPLLLLSPRKLVALQGFPSILRELLPLHFTPRVLGSCEPDYPVSLHPVAGWFSPTGPFPLLKVPPCGWRTRCLLRSTCPLVCIHI